MSALPNVNESQYMSTPIVERNTRHDRKADVVRTIQDLPNDILYKVLEHLPLTERYRLPGICKAWRRLKLDGLISIDFFKTVRRQKSQAIIESLRDLIERNRKTLCSLTVHLDHQQCLRGRWGVCKCKLPCIMLLPRKHSIPSPLSQGEKVSSGSMSLLMRSWLWYYVCFQKSLWSIQTFFKICHTWAI